MNAIQSIATTLAPATPEVSPIEFALALDNCRTVIVRTQEVTEVIEGERLQAAFLIGAASLEARTHIAAMGKSCKFGSWGEWLEKACDVSPHWVRKCEGAYKANERIQAMPAPLRAKAIAGYKSVESMYEFHRAVETGEDARELIENRKAPVIGRPKVEKLKIDNRPLDKEDDSKDTDTGKGANEHAALAKREAALDKREAALNARAAALDERERLLALREAALLTQPVSDATAKPATPSADAGEASLEAAREAMRKGDAKRASVKAKADEAAKGTAEPAPGAKAPRKAKAGGKVASAGKTPQIAPIRVRATPPGKDALLAPVETLMTPAVNGKPGDNALGEVF